MIQVLYEDNHIIAVNKRCGDIVQGDKTGDSTLGDAIKLYLKEKYHKPGNVFLGVVHRLDRPTSGVLLFSRTSKALSRLNELFRHSGEVEKQYWAVVDNRPDKDEGTLTHWLTKKPSQNKSYASTFEKPGSKKAQLFYKYITSSNRFHLLEIKLHTGRHHQIRAQLAAIGLHIRGDLKYGFPRPNKDAGIHLHARKIELIHPIIKKPISITASPPENTVWNLFANAYPNP